MGGGGGAWGGRGNDPARGRGRGDAAAETVPCPCRSEAASGRRAASRGACHTKPVRDPIRGRKTSVAAPAEGRIYIISNTKCSWTTGRGNREESWSVANLGLAARRGRVSVAHEDEVVHPRLVASGQGRGLSEESCTGQATSDWRPAAHRLQGCQELSLHVSHGHNRGWGGDGASSRRRVASIRFLRFPFVDKRLRRRRSQREASRLLPLVASHSHTLRPVKPLAA